ncbi:NAD-dependent epimerase/dehydratase family protein, partial [Candidatus Woesearchaeota archaeon]|nr:NAD-dependent epimerase/dehydratase family protein [Candidatus Woesearchaeota archaeon]
RVKFIQGDILDQDMLDKACKNIDFVVHAVSLVPISQAGIKFYDVNVTGTELILKSAVKSKVKKFIHISSSSVYGIHHKMPLTESSPIIPYGDYPKAKYDAEKICSEYRKKGLNIIIIRPRTIIGPGRLGIFQILFDWIENNNKVFVLSQGKNKFQFVSAEDLSESVILSITNKIKNEDFNIGSEEFTTMRTYLLHLIKHAKSKSKIVSLNKNIVLFFMGFLEKFRLSPMTKWHMYAFSEDFYFDVSKAKKILNWKSGSRDVDTLIKTYDWYISHKQEAFDSSKSTHKKAPSQKLMKLLKYL